MRRDDRQTRGEAVPGWQAVEGDRDRRGARRSTTCRIGRRVTTVRRRVASAGASPTARRRVASNRFLRRRVDQCRIGDAALGDRRDVGSTDASSASTGCRIEPMRRRRFDEVFASTILRDESTGAASAMHRPGNRRDVGSTDPSSTSTRCRIGRPVVHESTNIASTVRRPRCGQTASTGASSGSTRFASTDASFATRRGVERPMLRPRRCPHRPMHRP